mmetsp:Transcript_15171/g.17592  ORF Transcript_15171/g.17592 Transcript_15171/m.17592 type:complete len:190 (+) Transcript_15171:945-1514(+)
MNEPKNPVRRFPYKTKEQELQETSKHTPQSKSRKAENSGSFYQEAKKLIKCSEGAANAGESNNNFQTGGVKGGSSVSGDNVVVQIDEEEEKRLILEDPLRKRVFVHIAQTSNSVQVAWSHSNKIKSEKRIQYILEYGVGVKMSGQEQFRTIYNGKAHKCIITDLMPRTAYRFKVVAYKLDEDGKDVFGE